MQAPPELQDISTVTQPVASSTFRGIVATMQNCSNRCAKFGPLASLRLNFLVSSLASLSCSGSMLSFQHRFSTTDFEALSKLNSRECSSASQQNCTSSSSCKSLAASIGLRSLLKLNSPEFSSVYPRIALSALSCKSRFAMNGR